MIEKDCVVFPGTIWVSPPTYPSGERKNYKVNSPNENEQCETTPYCVSRMLEIMPLRKKERCGSCRRIFTPEN